MTFRELLCEQLNASRDAAEANELLGHTELGEWWRWRAADLERFLRDVSALEA